MGTSGRTPGRGARWRVAEPVGLGETIRRVIDRRFAGNLAAAARASGIPQQTLDRIAKGKAKAVRRWTLHQLRGLWGEDLDDSAAQEIAGTLVDPSSEESANRYNEWSDNEVQRLRSGAKSREGERGSYAKLLERAKRLVPELTTRFLRTVADSDRRRSVIAVLRVLDGLLAHQGSGGVERDWDDLTDDELRDYLRAGLKREKILLARTALMERIQGARLAPGDRPRAR